MSNKLKAADCRVGNWLSKHGEQYQITSATIVGLERGDSEVEPIPLTEEWLLKFGFEKREASSCVAWHIGENPITHDWLFDLVWLDKPELIGAENYPFYRNGYHLIKYVHQLQNLFYCLCGKELELTTND